MTTKLVKDDYDQLKVSSAEAFNTWVTRVEYALNNLNDRSVLNSSPLAHLTYVEKMAKEKYYSHVLPRGLALHDVLLSCVQKISSELGNEPRLARCCKYVELLSEGINCRQISKQLGIPREHVSRVYRKKAIELVTEEFLSTVNNSK
jgi:hypothetical protein